MSPRHRLLAEVSTEELQWVRAPYFLSRPVWKILSSFGVLAMYQFCVLMSQPYSILFLVLTVAVVVLWRRRRESRKAMLLLTVPLLILTAINLPVVANLTAGGLEWQYPLTRERPPEAGAIVVLCGWVRPADDLVPEPELGTDTLNRCLHAARLYHQGKPCPIVVSGGAPGDTPGPTMAEAMRDFLMTQGVPERDILLEKRALSGYANAVETGKLLAEQGIRNVVLVTSAIHMPRAAACFRSQGISFSASPCDYLALRFRPSALDFWPNAEAGRKFQAAAREWVGLAWYHLRGRI